MLIDSNLLDDLSSQAASSQRLRMNFDLRTTPEDGSQRMLNALEPGTCVPVHRHRTTNEVVVLLRGRAVQYFYNDAGEVMDAVLMVPSGCPVDDLDDLSSNAGVKLNSVCSALTVEPGCWHRIDPLESGTVIFESKDGAWEPLAPEDIIDLSGTNK